MELYKDVQAKGTRVPPVLCSGGSSIASSATGGQESMSDMFAMQGHEFIKMINRGFDQQALQSEIDGLMLELTPQLKDQHALLRQMVSIMK